MHGLNDETLTSLASAKYCKHCLGRSLFRHLIVMSVGHIITLFHYNSMPFSVKNIYTYINHEFVYFN